MNLGARPHSFSGESGKFRSAGGKNGSYGATAAKAIPERDKKKNDFPWSFRWSSWPDFVVAVAFNDRIHHYSRSDLNFKPLMKKYVFLQIRDFKTPLWKVSKSSDRHSIFSYKPLLLRQKMLGLLEKDDVFSCVAKLEGAPLLLGQIVLEALDLWWLWPTAVDPEPRGPRWDDASRGLLTKFWMALTQQSVGFWEILDFVQRLVI